MGKYNDEGPQAKLGRAGETIVLNWFSKKGIPFEASVDQYDSEKDILAEGKKVEVKTQVPFVTKDSFSFRKNQLAKCLTVDKLFFVSVPMEKRDHYSCGRVYCVDNPKDNLAWVDHQTKDGRRMILVPINQASMKEVFTMTYDECKILMKYSSTEKV